MNQGYMGKTDWTVYSNIVSSQILKQWPEKKIWNKIFSPLKTWAVVRSEKGWETFP